MEADDRRGHRARPDVDGGVEDAERAFVAGLIARGEAARPDEHGNLPAGATHELVEDEAGRTIARRRRFA